MSEAPRRKLIEVALPLDAINAASQAESRNPFIRAHPKSLKWWARRPLAACRAVLFAQLVDDPSSLPEEFPTEEDQDRERERLFGIIEELVKWENSTKEQVLEAARAEILKSTDGDPPPILDPFAGGGSIPLEAQRLGLEAHASDLNPVAVLINKALIEIPPRWADQPPVHPDAVRRTHWRGAEGLAEDVRLYGKWMRDEAERRIGHLYPKAKLGDGSEATVIAWIWARAIPCPNPACRAVIPLVSTFWLSKKRGSEAWLEPLVDGYAVRFDVRVDPPGPPKPPKVGRGAKFKCLVCEEIASESELEDAFSTGRGTVMQLARVVKEGRRTLYLPGLHGATASADSYEADYLALALPDDPRVFWFKSYGLKSHGDLYSDRQRRVLDVLVDLIDVACDRVREAAESSRDDPVGYAADMKLMLTHCHARVVMFNNALCTWNVTNTNVTNPFGMTAPSFAWDYVEANALDGPTGIIAAARKVAEVIEALPTPEGLQPVISQADATEAWPFPNGVICTDPPYYDNVTYSDMADVFYLWFRRSLSRTEPELTRTVATPKDAELVANPVRHGGQAAADAFFEVGFAEAFARGLQSLRDGHVMTFFYAFKQGESSDSVGLASTGWSTMLEGLLASGWSVTATWPIRTERAARRRGQESNALASSVVLACRPRPVGASVTDRRGMVRALRERLPRALHELQKAHIAPVDLRQAAIGPGMEVFSSYARVVESDESSMSVRTALGLINQVLDEVLGEQEAEFDAETRWAIQWFSQFFEDEAEYGVAEQLAVSMNVAVDGLRRSGIVESGGGTVRLLTRGEYPDVWDPLVDARVPVWEACQHLVKRLEEQGEAAAGALLARLEQRGSLGEAAQLLAYRLFTVCERERPALAGPYNALIAAWPEIQRHARTQPTSGPAQQTAFDT